MPIQQAKQKKELWCTPTLIVLTPDLPSDVMMFIDSCKHLSKPPRVQPNQFFGECTANSKKCKRCASTTV